MPPPHQAQVSGQINIAKEQVASATVVACCSRCQRSAAPGSAADLSATWTAIGRPRISATTVRLVPMVRPPRRPASRNVGPAHPPRTVWASIISIEGVAALLCFRQTSRASRVIARSQTPLARQRRHCCQTAPPVNGHVEVPTRRQAGTLSWPRTGVMSGLKEFQRATVEYAFERLYTDPEPVNRFFMADEVGLGKTLVPRGVIAKTIDHLRASGVKRIDVLYICSNADIATEHPQAECDRPGWVRPGNKNHTPADATAPAQGGRDQLRLVHAWDELRHGRPSRTR
jgi:hypothetical protein